MIEEDEAHNVEIGAFTLLQKMREENYTLYLYNVLLVT